MNSLFYIKFITDCQTNVLKTKKGIRENEDIMKLICLKVKLSGF